MAFQVGGSADDELAEVHDINVTPFIDVVLVLLIVFMVAAPLVTVDVPVDLPSSTAQAQRRPDKPVFLTLKADMSILVGESPVLRPALPAALNVASSNDKTQRVFLRADRTVPYSELMAAMDLLRDAGYLKVALVTLEGQARP